MKRFLVEKGQVGGRGREVRMFVGLKGRAGWKDGKMGGGVGFEMEEGRKKKDICMGRRKGGSSMQRGMRRRYLSE